MVRALAQVCFCISQFGTVLRLQIRLLLRLLNVLVRLTDDVLLAIYEGGQLVQALIGLAAFAPWHLQNILVERAHLEEVYFRSKGVASLRVSFRVIG